MTSELFYQLALTLVPQIGPAQAKLLLQVFDISEIFRARVADLAQVEGVGMLRAEAIQRFNDFKRVEQEMRFLEQTGARALFLTDPGYPKRLLHCYDPPTLLFYRGN